jgi:hypothetical protein
MPKTPQGDGNARYRFRQSSDSLTFMPKTPQGDGNHSVLQPTLNHFLLSCLKPRKGTETTNQDSVKKNPREPLSCLKPRKGTETTVIFRA